MVTYQHEAPSRVVPAGEHEGTIVVIEDPFIRRYLRDLLVRYGFRVIGSDVTAVTEMLRSGSEHVNLIITNKPAEFLAFGDQVPVLYLSAMPDLGLAAQFLHCRTISKPFRPEQLVEAVRDLTAAL